MAAWDRKTWKKSIPRIFPGFVLLALTALAFAPVLENGFSGLDDPIYVTGNHRVLSGLTRDGFRWAWTTFHAANWHPLTWLSLMADVSFFGPDPRGIHLVSLCIHALASLFLYLALDSFTARRRLSFSIAVMFAVHPLRVESVAWISERKDVLCAFFWCLAMWLYGIHIRRPRFVSYLAVLAAFTMALLAKPMAATLPMIFILLDFWPLGRRVSILEKVPFLLRSAGSATLTLLAQKSGGMIRSLEAISLNIRLANVLVSYVRYLGKILWPLDLYLPYPYEKELLSGGNMVLSAVILAGISGVAWASRRRRPGLAVGCLWYLVTLTPVIGIIHVGDQAMADRYSYLPSIGVFIALLTLAGDAVARSGAARAISGTLFAAAATACIFMTRAQVRFWHDDVALFSHAVDINPRNYFAHSNLGAALVGAGRPTEAFPHYREAISLKPNFADALYNEAVLYLATGNPVAAEERFRQVLALAPNDPNAHLNLGTILAATGRTREALQHYSAAVKAQPDNAVAMHNIGASLEDLGNIPEAAAHYRRALALDPANPEIRESLERVSR